MIRDTSLYTAFRAYTKGKTPSLKRLAKEVLGRDIQGGVHSSVEDAQTALELFKKVKNDWENVINRRNRASEGMLLVFLIFSTEIPLNCD